MIGICVCVCFVFVVISRSAICCVLSLFFFPEWRNCRCIVSLKFRLGESQNEQSFLVCYQSRECILNQEKRFGFVSVVLLRVFWSFVFFLIVNDFLLLSLQMGTGGHCLFCVLHLYILMYLCVRLCIHPSRYACERCERRIQRRSKQSSGENSLVFLALHCLSYGCLCFCSMLFDSVCLLYFIAVRYLYIYIYIHD